MRRLVAFLLPLACATAAFAGDGPSFDCSRSGSVVEHLICTDADLAALDRRLADRYAAASQAARALDAGAAAAERALKATQVGWIGGREECWKSSDIRDCIETAYLRREGELVALWLLEPPTAVARWTCEGNPANEVVTSFFDTPLPSVRFERGDSVDAGTLRRTASGARYEGSFGRSIWIKGEEATYREPDPDGSTLNCALAGQS